MIVEILATRLGGPVTRTDLNNWISSGKLVVTSVRDPDSNNAQSITALERREIAYIVDLETMTILRRIEGSVAGSGDSAVKTAIAEMLVLLGAKGG